MSGLVHGINLRVWYFARAPCATRWRLLSYVPAYPRPIAVRPMHGKHRHSAFSHRHGAGHVDVVVHDTKTLPKCKAACEENPSMPPRSLVVDMHAHCMCDLIVVHGMQRTLRRRLCMHVGADLLSAGVRPWHVRVRVRCLGEEMVCVCMSVPVPMFCEGNWCVLTRLTRVRIVDRLPFCAQNTFDVVLHCAVNSALVACGWRSRWNAGAHAGQNSEKGALGGPNNAATRGAVKASWCIGSRGRCAAAMQQVQLYVASTKRPYTHAHLMVYTV